MKRYTVHLHVSDGYGGDDDETIELACQITNDILAAVVGADVSVSVPADWREWDDLGEPVG